MADELGNDKLAVVLDRLFARIDNREKLHEMHLALQRIEQRQQQQTLDIEEVRDSVYGNGIPGIKTNVDRLLQDFESRQWRDRLIITGLLLALIGEAVAFIHWSVSINNPVTG